MEKPKAHVAQWKKDKVDLLKSLFLKHKTIGVIDTTNLPSAQMQRMRAHLRSQGMILLMARMRLIKRALNLVKDSKLNIIELEAYIKGIPAIIFLDDNPFRLAKFISKNKGSASAKPGQIAPIDLYVPAGPTPFTPGPVIGELSSLGIKTAIEGGKISIKDTTRIVKQGEVISEKASAILAKLGIEPMEIGMDLVAAYENGIVYKKDVLSINEKEIIDKLKQAHRESLNLAFNRAIPIKEVISILIKKAYLDGLGLSKKINFEVNKEIVEQVHQEQPKSIHKEQPKEVHKEQPKNITVKEIEKASKVLSANENFEIEQKQAQDILSKLQDQKIKNN